MKSVYQFSNSQDYLRSSFEEAKTQDRALTLEKYADQIGIGCSALKMILTGKRKLTFKKSILLARLQKLSTEETEYLHSLTLKSNAADVTEKRFYAKKLSALKEDARVRSVPLTGRKVLTDPYILPILVFVTEFTEQGGKEILQDQSMLEEIARRLKIEPSRVQKNLELLAKMGVLKNDPKDTLDTHFVFSNLAQILSQQNYLKFLLAEAAKKIDSSYSDPGNFFHSSILSIDEKNAPAMAREMKAVVEKYISAPKTQGSILISSSFQLFPITVD